MSKTQACIDTLAKARIRVPSASIWQHYRGGIYAVTGHTIDTTNGQARVLYFRVGGPDYEADRENGITFARPVDEWFENGDDGEKRFTLLADYGVVVTTSD